MDNEKVVLSNNGLVELYGICKKFVSKDKSRYFLWNVVIDTTLKNMVATDGKCLCRIDISKYSDELSTLDNDSVYSLLSVDKSTLVCSKMSGFPKYARVIPPMDDLEYMDNDILLSGKKEYDNENLGLFISKLDIALNFNTWAKIPKKKEFRLYRTRNENGKLSNCMYLKCENIILIFMGLHN